MAGVELLAPLRKETDAGPRSNRGARALNIVVIAGSGRPKSESRRVSDAVCRLLRQAGCGVGLVDLHVLNLPFWDEASTLDAEWRKAHWLPVSQRLAAADGFVVVTPEWDGMVPPQLKNFFVFCDDCELAHKPGLIVSVADGLSGSYPVSELRMSSYKNTFIVWLPVHVIIRNVTKLALSREAGQPEEALKVMTRLENGLEILTAYAAALADVRRSGQAALTAHQFGM